jgi:hypothetical protein
MTDRQTQAVAEAIYKARMGSELTFAPNNYIVKAYIQVAEAAITASDAKYIKGLVEALTALVSAKEMKEIGAQEYPATKARAWELARNALAALPEDIRNG